ncbi:MAG: hypothetical protein KAJ19_26890 [Gammaproteobacteria bacterium]|nr:hypothetical protein [Gammaproteobacteria bacterium]
MSFETVAQDPTSVLNLVIKIDDVYFAQSQVDSGLVVDADKLGLIRTAKISGNSVDIRDVKTSISNLTFDLIDANSSISTFLMSKRNNYLEDRVQLFAGFTTGTFDFSDYKEFAITKLKTVTKGDNRYSFVAQELTSEIKKEAFFTESSLDGNISDTATELTLLDAEEFPDSGQVKIGNEYITYNGKTDNTLENLSRGNLAGQAEDHKDGDTVSLVTELEDNPIDMMLDIMQNTLGIPSSDIDINSFTDIRDVFFPLSEVRFFITGLEDTLTFFEDEILQVINCRMTSVDGLISLAILDQTDFKVQPRALDEGSIIGTPRWQITSKKLTNRIEILWNYSEGERRYSRTSTFDDQDSIDIYGVQKTLTYEFKGVKADIDGSLLVENMGARLLARLKNTQAKITSSCFFEESDLKIGEDVSLSHRFLPQQGGTLGMSDQRLEIMSKAFDFENKRVIFDLQFTSFSNLRVGLIAPSPLIVSVTDQRTFEVPIGSQYLPGYKLRLWDVNANDYYPDVAIEIESVVGNTITMKSDFSTPLTTNVKVKFPIYSESSSQQIAKYAYVAPNTGFFNDNSKAYEILI